MFYLLHGADDYSIQERITALTADRERVYVDDVEDLSLLASHGTQHGLFGEQPILVLRNLLKSISPTWLDDHAEQDIVFVETQKIDKRSATYKKIVQIGIEEEFTQKDKGQLFAWVRTKGLSIEPKVLQLLWDRHGANMWLWHHELEKLSAFAAYDNTITTEHIEIISKKTLEENIFEFVDAFGNRTMTALAQYARIIESGADQFYLLSMLARQVRLLLLATETDGLTGNHPFVVQKLKQQIQQWNVQELKDVYNHLVQIDYRVKTGEGDIEDELPDFLLRYITEQAEKGDF